MKSGSRDQVHARCAHAVDGDDEIESGEDGGESVDERREARFDHFRAGKGGTVRRVERPTGIDAAVRMT